MVWELLSITYDSLAILLSPTTCTVSRGTSQDRAGLLQQVSVLILSVAVMLLPQQTTPKRRADATTVSIKVLSSPRCTPKELNGSESRAYSDPSYRVTACSVSSPVVIEVSTQVFVRVHNVNVHSLDIDHCKQVVSAPEEIHHQLFDVSHVDLEVVPLAPGHSQFSVLPVILICEEANDRSVIRELLQVGGV